MIDVQDLASLIKAYKEDLQGKILFETEDSVCILAPNGAWFILPKSLPQKKKE